MNKIAEVKNLEKGQQAEIQGQVTYSMEPRQFGKSISQFIVVKDGQNQEDGIGCNVGLQTMEEKLVNGNNVQVKGVVDKYPDKKNPNPDGSLPIATSLKGYIVEGTVNADDFPYGLNVATTDKVEQIVNKEETKVLPAKSKREPVELKNPQKEQPKQYTNNDYWREKTLRDIENNKCIVRECAIKAVTRIYTIPDEYHENPFIKTEKEYYEFAEKIVDWIYDKPTDEPPVHQTEGEISDKDLILSGAKTKAEMIAYINDRRAGTPYERDDEFYVNLSCQLLTHQKKEELIETVEKLEEVLRG